MRLFFSIAALFLLGADFAIAKPTKVELIKGNGVGQDEVYPEGDPRVMDSHSVGIKRAPATLEAPIYADPKLPDGKPLPTPEVLAPPPAEAQPAPEAEPKP